MKKFILIDQSIKDGAVHHLEYALRVLKAAKQEGFLTVLAVNKSCDIIESSFIDVVERSFTYGYWENYSCQKQDLKKDRKELLKTFLEKKDDFIYEIIFSQLGFAYHLLSSGKSVSRMAGEHDFTTEDQKISSYSLTVSSVLYRIWHYCKKAKLFFERIIKIAGKPVQYVFRLMKFFLAILLFPIIIVYLVFKWDIILSRFDQFSLLFARECNRLLDKISVENGDLIFVPTLGDLELTGIGICSKEKRLSGIEWHLLFRRNLFTGREGDYLRQMDSV